MSFDNSRMRPPFRPMPPLGPPKATPRQRILSQWHGVDLHPLEQARLKARPVREIMPRILSDLRIDHRQSEAEIVRVWNHLLDPTVVAHAQPTGLRKGTLFVTVDSNAWLSEILTYRRKEILARLQHSFGRDLITRISFRVG